MISMRYECPKCGWAGAVLDDAQLHANETRHSVKIEGFITTNSSFVSSQERANAAALQRAKDAAIMRAARDKGLVKGR